MDWESTHEYCKSCDEEICDNCGAKYKVFIPAQKGHMESEEYFCPECNKGYSCWASNTPRVDLISARTDGKKDKYDNTNWLISRGLIDE